MPIAGREGNLTQSRAVEIAETQRSIMNVIDFLEHLPSHDELSRRTLQAYLAELQQKLAGMANDLKKEH